MSERHGKHKQHKSKREKSVAVKSEYPVEVLVYDPIQKEKVVAEYVGENRWWFSTRMFKVYHPSFQGGSRWVLKLGRILGQFDPAKEFPSQSQLDTEKRVIARLMKE